MNEDKLTGLQDRGSFMQRLKLHCEQAITMGHLLGLVIIDLDRFYRINDQFGFQVGDEALRHVASLATGVARKRDLVARIGGNQFALILPGIMNQGHAVLAAAKLFRMMEAPIELCGHKVVMKGSAGIAVSPNHSSNFDRLFAHAERAMRQARESEESYLLSDADADESDDNAVSLEFELESAFVSGDLRMFFQPKVQMSSRRPVGAEALMRWKSGIRGYVPPEQFIAAGERAGLINSMTQWALNVSLQLAAKWPDRFGPQTISVNLSPTVMADPDLIDMVSNCLGVWEVPRDALVLEVTESSALSDPEKNFQKFEELADLGVQISLDDFGTGYSSLAYFRDIPADEVKLDKMFVQRMVSSEADRKIARLVIELAHAFDMTITAEGVEDADTFRLLASMGCDYAQGFFIAKPMPHEEYLLWLKQYDGLSQQGAKFRRAS